MPTEYFITIKHYVSAIELLEHVELLNSGLISEDEFLVSVGYDVPAATASKPIIRPVTGRNVINLPYIPAVARVK